MAKTAYLKTQDNEKIKVYEGEITGYNKRLQQLNLDARDALETIQQKEQQIMEKEKELKNMRAELADKDSSELIEVKSWSVSESWKLLQYLKKDFEITSPLKIESVTKWTNGHCRWSNYEETCYKVKGIVEGNFMRGIYANLSLMTFKRNKYRNEITSLKQLISATEGHRVALKEHLTEIKKRHKAFKNDIEDFEKFIDERRVWIEDLVSDYLSLDEANERLKTFKSKL